MNYANVIRTMHFDWFLQVMWLGMTTNERLNQARYFYMEALSKKRKVDGDCPTGQQHGHSHGVGDKQCFADHTKNKYNNPFQ